jgi:hypothetical protein
MLAFIQKENGICLKRFGRRYRVVYIWWCMFFTGNPCKCFVSYALMAMRKMQAFI